MWGIAAACVLAAYFIGAVPFGLLVGRLKGVDVRRHGSGNIGATNVGRVLGTGYGLAVFGLDLLKGLIPVIIAGQLLPTRVGDPGQASGLLVWITVAAAAILGHMYPAYLGFRGGKGVATSLGVLLGIYPYFTWPGLAAFGLWVLLTATTRYVSVGSMTAAGAFPIMFALFARSREWGPGRGLWPLYTFAVAVGLLVIVKHRGNLRRLMAGTEPRIGTSRAEGGKPGGR